MRQRGRVCHSAQGSQSAGFCLTELLVALAIGTVVIAMAFQVVTNLEGRFRVQHRGMALEQDARLGLAVFEQEVLSATVDAVDGSVLRRADSSTLEFLANVNGQDTVLTAAALVGQLDLSVQDGSDWQEGKQVRICGLGRCWQNRLARDGQRSRLALAIPLSETVPAGTTVSVVNEVRYYVLPGARGTFRFMRQIDGGANTLIGDLRAVSLTYRDRFGRATVDPQTVATVRLQMSVGDERRRVLQEVGLRT